MTHQGTDSNLVKFTFDTDSLAIKPFRQQDFPYSYFIFVQAIGPPQSEGAIALAPWKFEDKPPFSPLVGHWPMYGIPVGPTLLVEANFHTPGHVDPATVPEPSGLLLLGQGLLFAAFTHWRAVRAKKSPRA